MQEEIEINREITSDNAIAVYKAMIEAFQETMREEIGLTGFPMSFIDIILKATCLTIYRRATGCSDITSKAVWILQFQTFCMDMLQEFTKNIMGEEVENVQKH